MHTSQCKPIGSLFLLGLIIHAALTIWILVCVALSPSSVTDFIVTVGSVLFLLHSFVADLIMPPSRTDPSFGEIFLTLFITFPVSLLWAFCIRRIFSHAVEKSNITQKSNYLTNTPLQSPLHISPK
jgi:hypothetical protein